MFVQHKGIEIWARPVTPIYENYFSYALAFVNRRTDGTPSDVAVALHEMGLLSNTGYRIQVIMHPRLCELVLETGSRAKYTRIDRETVFKVVGL